MQRICRKTLEDIIYDGTVPILTYTIHYPCFNSTCCPASARRINDYYYLEAKHSEHYCRTVLYKQALEDAQQIQDRPPLSYEYYVDFTITYSTGCIVSLFTDTYTFTGGAHGNTKRTSHTWDFREGTLMQLSDFYPLTPESLVMLQTCIERQITDKEAENPGIYFDDYKFLLKDYFNSSSFYLQPCNGVIYYQHYEIAPYSTGIPEFCFPIQMFCSC